MLGLDYDLEASVGLSSMGCPVIVCLFLSFFSLLFIILSYLSYLDGEQ